MNGYIKSQDYQLDIKEIDMPKGLNLLTKSITHFIL